MNNQEINLKIAEIKGHIPYQGGNGVRLKSMTGNHAYFTLDVPDINDWKILGPLEDELLESKWYLQKHGTNYIWTKQSPTFRRFNGMSIQHECRCKASCLAYIEEFGGE